MRGVCRKLVSSLGFMLRSYSALIVSAYAFSRVLRSAVSLVSCLSRMSRRFLSSMRSWYWILPRSLMLQASPTLSETPLPTDSCRISFVPLCTARPFSSFAASASAAAALPLRGCSSSPQSLSTLRGPLLQWVQVLIIKQKSLPSGGSFAWCG